LKQFNSKSCEEIMTTVYKPIEFVIDGLIAQGLYILAGAPKVGKSWLALDMCLSIAKGEKILGLKTSQGTALYLCLEDSYARIQNRLYELTDEPTEMLYFSVMSDPIGGGLEEQIEGFMSEHRDLKIVFIDTLQMVRSDTDSSYGSDYKDLSVLKALADKLEIAIIVVHHTRKCKDIDPFNMISGSTGISGCVDGSMVLVETKRGSRNAKLYCVGRDIENAEISLHFDSDLKKWVVTDEPSAPKSKDNIFLAALYVYLKRYISFTGTASELVSELKEVTQEQFYPNRVTRDLVQNGYTLRKYGIDFQYKRTRNCRLIILHYDRERDSSDSKNTSEVTVNKLTSKV
jgi:replicative DNA helicase